MGLRHLLGGALALALLSTAALADNRAAGEGWGLDLPGVSLPKLFGGKSPERAPANAQAPVRVAQAGDPRISELQEQIRSLSGTVEEMNFQILQMQEQMRKQQEDFEFRFQEIEGGGGAATKPAKPAKKSEVVPPATEGGTSVASVIEKTEKVAPADVLSPADGDRAPADAAATFGTITFDASGNVTGGSVGDQSVVSRGAEVPTSPTGTDQTQVAALPSTDNPEELYQNAYEFILSGDYVTAEAGFRDHLNRFPTDARNADAEFWLGEALLAQNKYRDAAQVFLAANKEHPKSKKAPEMLLKLGVSLAGLNQRDVACATFAEVNKRYPNISAPLKQRLSQEKSRASC